MTNLGFERRKNLDLARGIAVHCMIAVHLLHILGEKDERKTFLGRVVDFLGGAPAAPVFLFVMGLLVAGSERSSRCLAARGLKLLALAYALNFFRASLPVMAGLPFPESAWESFFMVDILHLAGFGFLALPWLRRLPAWVPALTALVTAFLAPHLWGITGPSPAWLDPLWGYHWAVFFPVFPWIAFPLAGMACHGLEKHFLVSLAAVALLVAGVWLHRSAFDNEFFTYYRSTPGAVLWMTGFVILWLKACAPLSLRAAPIMPYFRFWSENVTVAYVISWLLIMWLIGIFGYQELRLSALAPVFLAVTAATGLGTATIVRFFPAISNR